MSRSTPWQVVFAAVSVVASVSPLTGQNPNQNPNQPTATRSTNTPRSSGNNPSLTNPSSGSNSSFRTNGVGDGNRQPGKTPPRVNNSGGGNGAAIAGGIAGAAAIAGIALFEHLHGAHPPNSGPTVQRLKLSLRYPNDWQLNQQLNQQDDPISLNNHNSSYLPGGILVMGGADIDVATFPDTGRPVSQLIAAELADADQRTIDSHAYSIDGQKGTRVFYTDVYEQNFILKNVAVYVPWGGNLYKFFLTYHEGDRQEKSYNDDFELVLKSVRFQR